MSGEQFSTTLEQRAADLLPEPVWRFVSAGARDGVTAAEAARAWDRQRFLPRVLRDVTEVTTATAVLGTALRSPFAIAPTTMQRAVHPEGEVAMARAAAASGTLLVLSSNAGSTFADVAATGVPWWLQMYLTADRTTSLPLLRRAVDAGARAVVLTVDTPVVGTKYAGDGTDVWASAEPGWVRVNFPPGHGDAPGDQKATDLGPQDVDWLARVTGLPVVVKGVLRADDAKRCLDAGASAVWVSNHGGRQLDRSAATADRLGVVAGAVTGAAAGAVSAAPSVGGAPARAGTAGADGRAGSRAEVYVDGGVRTATHGLAALALGARAVFLGRLALYALAVDGEPGVCRLLEELRTGLAEALTLLGCQAPQGVGLDVLAPRTG